MANEAPIPVGMGLPVDKRLRKRLQALTHGKLPAVYPDSVVRPCAGCKMDILGRTPHAGDGRDLLLPILRGADQRAKPVSD